MINEANTYKNLEIQISDSNKKKSLQETLKETHKSQNKPKKIKLKNSKENLLKEKGKINNNIYNEGLNSSKQLKENTKIRKPEIVKLKLIPDDAKIKTDIITQEIHLRTIYVDLNEENINNQDGNSTNNIISFQKTRYSDNSIRTCQYTIITFFPLALFNQFKSAFNWFFLIYNIIACIPQLSDLDPLAEVTLLQKLLLLLLY